MCQRKNRRVAGQDPAKRSQILDGARRAFLEKGFDAASMNDITRSAGVSKGTIYVYFENKEDLFTALIAHERRKWLDRVSAKLDSSRPVQEVLYSYGMAMAEEFSNDENIRAFRMVVNVVGRLPHLPESPFHPDSRENAWKVLEAYLEGQRSLGHIVADDIEIASVQFVEMACGRFFRQKLFCNTCGFPDAADRKRYIQAAVDVFMKVYGAENNRS